MALLTECKTFGFSAGYKHGTPKGVWGNAHATRRILLLSVNLEATLSYHQPGERIGYSATFDEKSFLANVDLASRRSTYCLKEPDPLRS
jgi:hypothetical protein